MSLLFVFGEKEMIHEQIIDTSNVILSKFGTLVLSICVLLYLFFVLRARVKI